jgi:hypothetical protein
MLDSPLNPQTIRLNWDLVNVHASALLILPIIRLLADLKVQLTSFFDKEG